MCEWRSENVMVIEVKVVALRQNFCISNCPIHLHCHHHPEDSSVGDLQKIVKISVVMLKGRRDSGKMRSSGSFLIVNTVAK